MTPNSSSKQARSLWGTTRANIAAMITGVTDGFKRELEIQGVGYRAELKGKALNMALGFSHPVEFKLPDVGEGISEGVTEFKGDFILNLVGRFDAQDFIFQAKDGASQAWYLNALGNQANLDIDDHQVIDVELMRRGIRKRGVFGLIGSLEPKAV